MPVKVSVQNYSRLLVWFLCNSCHPWDGTGQDRTKWNWHWLCQCTNTSCVSCLNLGLFHSILWGISSLTDFAAGRKDVSPNILLWSSLCTNMDRHEGFATFTRNFKIGLGMLIGHWEGQRKVENGQCFGDAEICHCCCFRQMSQVYYHPQMINLLHHFLVQQRQMAPSVIATWLNTALYLSWGIAQTTLKMALYYFKLCFETERGKP